MPSRTIRRVGSAAIERRRAKITAEIATLGLPLPGSLVERRTRCGNTGCCHGDPPQLHGPYLIWTRKEHTFRFVKSTLGWTTPALQTPDQADRWTWLVVAAYTQLRLARGLVDCLLYTS